MSILIDYCSLIRSKNAVAFVLTFDFMFKTPEYLRKVQQADVITKEASGKLFHMNVENITLAFYERAMVAKVSIPRLHFLGDIKDGDCYAVHTLLDMTPQQPVDQQGEQVKASAKRSMIHQTAKSCLHRIGRLRCSQSKPK
jgi:hypothetical protein